MKIRLVGAHRFKPYQQQALDWASTRKRIALFMEMRLGKSPVSIRWAKLRGAKRVLLMAPLSTLLGDYNWQGELQREGIVPTMFPHIPRSKRMAVVRPSVIKNGKLVRRWAQGWFGIHKEALRAQPEILEGPWDAIIVDESTCIRSPKAKITKLLTNHTGHIPQRAILTGLPNPEDPMDYFCQFRFKDGQFIGYDNYWEFRQRKFHNTWAQYSWAPNKGVRDQIKQYVHDNAFVLTRKDAGFADRKIRQQRAVSLNTLQVKALKELRQEYSIDGHETKWAPVIHTWMQRVAGGFHPVTNDLISDAKLRLVEDLVMGEFKKESVVIWFRFNHEIEAVHNFLTTRNKKLTCEFVHGEMKDSKTRRAKVQERFQRGKTRVILLQVALGKFGWNLSRSSTVMYYSNSWEFEARSQSEDRVIHITKDEPCLYMDLVTLGTPDEDVVASLSDKRFNARQFNKRLTAASVKRFTRLAA